MNFKKSKKQKRTWLNFSLRALFYFTLVIAAGIAYWSVKASNQRRIVTWVEQNGGSVWYENEAPMQLFVPQEHRYPHDWKWIPLSEESKKGLDKNYEWHVAGVDFVTVPGRIDLMAKTELADISPLAELKHLKYVRIGVSQVSDLSPLADLPDLVQLSILSTQVSDLKPLSGLTNLESLFIGNSNISDVTPISGLNKLNSLRFYSSKISDITPLASLNNLTSLSLYSSQVTDLSPLGELDSVVELDLPFTKVTDLKPLLKMKKLDKLILQSSPVTDLDSLEKLAAKLSKIDVTNTKLPPEEVDRIRKLYPKCKLVGP